MLNVAHNIPDFVLSSDLEDFTFSADQNVRFSLSQDSTLIFEETYTPDANNEIRILDLFSIIEPYLLETPMARFSYQLIVPGETLYKGFIVLLCRPIIPCSGVDFVTNYFLTTLAGRDKITSFGRTETLYLTTGSLSSVSIR